MKYCWLVPVYNSAHLLQPFLDAVEALNPRPDYIIWLENNSTDTTRQFIREYIGGEIRKNPIAGELLTMNFSRNHIQRFGKYDAIGQVMQRMWERARELQPEYVCRVDSDVFPRSPDALNILAAHGVDIVSAFVLRDYPGAGVSVAAKWQCGYGLKLFRMYRPLARIRKYGNGSLILASSAEAPRFYGNDYGLDRSPFTVGGGFTFFSNRVLNDNRLQWYPLYDLSKPGVEDIEKISEDYSFCVYAHDAGYQTCLDSLVDCEHVIFDCKHRCKPWTQAFGYNWQFGGESDTFGAVQRDSRPKKGINVH